jgi:hypothetical protein
MVDFSIAFFEFPYDLVFFLFWRQLNHVILFARPDALRDYPKPGRL